MVRQSKDGFLVRSQTRQSSCFSNGELVRSADTVDAEAAREVPEALSRTSSEGPIISQGNLAELRPPSAIVAGSEVPCAEFTPTGREQAHESIS